MFFWDPSVGLVVLLEKNWSEVRSVDPNFVLKVVVLKVRSVFIFSLIL